MSDETALTLLARRCRERAADVRSAGRSRPADRLEALAACFEGAAAHPAAQSLERRRPDIEAGRFPDGRFWEPAESGDLADCDAALGYIAVL